MNPVLPLPDPIAPAAPPFLFGLLLDLTFFLHLVAMNLLLGGALIAVSLRGSRRSGDAAHRDALARALEKAMPVLMAATVTLGVAPLLFLQARHGRVFFTSSILMGWAWLAIVPLAMAAYYAAYAAARRAEDMPPRRWLGATVAVLLLAVAFVQTTSATRSLRLETFVDAHRLDGRGLLLNLDDPTFWPRWLHVVLGAVAVAGLGVAHLARRWAGQPERAAWVARRGLSLFALATAANVFVGLAFLVALPKTVLIRLVGGGEPRSVVLLAASLLLAVALAGAALLAPGAKRRETAAVALAGLLVPTLVAMVLLRDEVRRVTFANAAVDPLPAAAPQWGAFALFAACLASAAVAIGWMVRALATARASAAVLLVLALAGATGCKEPPKPAAETAARYALHGRVVAVEKEKRTLTIAHDDVAGFMPAMTMEFVVRERDAVLLDRVAAGDEVTATLVVPDSRYWIEDLVVVKKGAGGPPAAGAKGVAEGDTLPDVTLVDQDGKAFRLGELKGRAYAVTFVFTRCPMPEYCPLLMKNFAAAEAALAGDPRLREATRLLTVSFDPRHDTPAVLKAFGRPFQRTSPPFAHWRLATGRDDAIRSLGTALELEYEEDTGSFVHNLRTAVVGRDGRLARLLRGNEWTPDELVAELRKAAGL